MVDSANPFLSLYLKVESTKETSHVYLTIMGGDRIAQFVLKNGR